MSTTSKLFVVTALAVSLAACATCPPRPAYGAAPAPARSQRQAEIIAREGDGWRIRFDTASGNCRVDVADGSQAQQTRAQADANNACEFFEDTYGPYYAPG